MTSRMFSMPVANRICKCTIGSPGYRPAPRRHGMHECVAAQQRTHMHAPCIKRGDWARARCQNELRLIVSDPEDAEAGTLAAGDGGGIE